jgi:hypothetical protein
MGSITVFPDERPCDIQFVGSTRLWIKKYRRTIGKLLSQYIWAGNRVHG